MNRGSRVLFLLLLLSVIATSTACSACSGWNRYWEGKAEVQRAKAEIERAKAARIWEQKRHEEAMHRIREENAAKAGPVFARILLVLAGGGVLIGLFFVGGQAAAQVIKAHAAARDVRPDARGFLPVRVEVVADTRPKGLLAAIAGPYTRDWVQVVEITNHATGEVRRRITAYSYADHQITVRDEVVSPPHDRLLTADAQHRILALIAHTLERLAEERGDPHLSHALDTLRTQIQGLPGMSTPGLLRSGDQVSGIGDQ